MSFGWAVYLQVLHPQGKNVAEAEFNAIGDMLAGVSWEILDTEEYKNDLEQPDFPDVPGIPHRVSQLLYHCPSTQHVFRTLLFVVPCHDYSIVRFSSL